MLVIYLTQYPFFEILRRKFKKFQRDNHKKSKSVQFHSAELVLQSCLLSLLNSLSGESLAGRTKCTVFAFCPAKAQSTGWTALMEYGRWESYKRLSARCQICTGGNRIGLKNPKASVHDFHGNMPYILFCAALRWRRFVNLRFKERKRHALIKSLAKHYKNYFLIFLTKLKNILRFALTNVIWKKESKSKHLFPKRDACFLFLCHIPRGYYKQGRLFSHLFHYF